ncbi:MAG: putative inorganic carbon transporter subunit DabA, partial [Acidobacteriota bacterium]
MNPASTVHQVLSASDRARLVADVSTAGSIAAPYWPLTAFVAVNPLGGLTDLAFDDATRAARGWFGARTHLPLEAYRAEHARGTVTDADLDRAILRHDPSLAGRQPLDLGGVRMGPIDLVRWDLLHGPVAAPLPPRRSGTVADALDEIMTGWCAAYVDEAHTPWQMPNRELGFYRSWRAV